MNENGYLIDDYSKRKVFQRNEMLKIENAEGKEVLEKLRIERFVDIEDEDYQYLQQMYDEVKEYL